MNVIPTAAGRRINTYSPQQNPSFGRAIVIKSKNSKLLEMLEHIDFFVWSEQKNPKCRYKGNVSYSKSKKRFSNGLLADDIEANTLHKFEGLIKDAFFNNGDKYNNLRKAESAFWKRTLKEANDAEDVVVIKSVEDLLELPMLQEDRVQIINCLKTFPTDDVN